MKERFFQKSFLKISMSITVKVLLFLAVIIIIQGLILYQHSKNVSVDLLQQALEEKGTTIAKSIGNSCQLQIQVGDYQSLQKLIETFKKEHLVPFISIYDGQGNLLSSTESKDTIDPTDHSLVKAEELSIGYETLRTKEEIMIIVYPIFVEVFDMSSESSGLDMEMGDEMLDLDVEMMAEPEEEITESEAPAEQTVKSRKIGFVKVHLSRNPLKTKIKVIQNRFLRTNVLVFLVVFIIVLYTANRIIKPLNEIVDMLHEISFSNDLTRRVKIPPQKEMGVLAQAFNTLIETLSFQIKNTKEGASKLTSSIQSIIKATMEQEGASRDQVSAVTETTASMAQLSQSSRLIDQNSQKVANLADKTLKSAQQGVDAVNKVVDSISRIEGKSKIINQTILELVDKISQIQEIISIINEFTEQTKLIAFNAAIEAASAKEVGRRFSVVATEVRKLAGDIEKSSQDVNKVIREIQDTSYETIKVSEEGQTEVRKGVEISVEAKEAITTIFELVAQTTNITKQISKYTGQQISANDDVVRAVKEILTLAERSMDNAKDTNVVTENLSELSENLTETVEKFKIE
ncbi:methyl-accepting chemotaxis protein [candidate division CSSED10-310 bacterium]|uniref:Methyl-accepting chemotaxis protein n=1 Tax=candidate division CSSED10-310 bacterium TaxID=2855610 RepID=A0ABV6Z1W1_UNCC1